MIKNSQLVSGSAMVLFAAVYEGSLWRIVLNTVGAL